MADKCRVNDRQQDRILNISQEPYNLLPMCPEMEKRGNIELCYTTKTKSEAFNLQILKPSFIEASLQDSGRCASNQKKQSLQKYVWKVRPPIKHRSITYTLHVPPEVLGETMKAELFLANIRKNFYHPQDHIISANSMEKVSNGYALEDLLKPI